MLSVDRDRLALHAPVRHHHDLQGLRVRHGFDQTLQMALQEQAAGHAFHYLIWEGGALGSVEI